MGPFRFKLIDRLIPQLSGYWSPLCSSLRSTTRSSLNAPRKSGHFYFVPKLGQTVDLPSYSHACGRSDSWPVRHSSDSKGGCQPVLFSGHGPTSSLHYSWHRNGSALNFWHLVVGSPCIMWMSISYCLLVSSFCSVTLANVCGKQ